MSAGRGQQYQGVVLEQFPGALFSVRLDGVHDRIVAHMEFSERRNYVRLLPGDRVTVELAAQNRTRGRITRRNPVLGNGRPSKGMSSV